jgi:hypothetical protein
MPEVLRGRRTCCLLHSATIVSGNLQTIAWEALCKRTSKAASPWLGTRKPVAQIRPFHHHCKGLNSPRFFISATADIFVNRQNLGPERIRLLPDDRRFLGFLRFPQSTRLRWISQNITPSENSTWNSALSARATPPGPATVLVQGVARRQSETSTRLGFACGVKLSCVGRRIHVFDQNLDIDG